MRIGTLFHETPSEHSPNKTAAANSLRLLQFNNIDHCPVILVHYTLPKETIQFYKESEKRANQDLT
jgi:hypothetical protein